MMSLVSFSSSSSSTTQYGLWSSLIVINISAKIVRTNSHKVLLVLQKHTDFQPFHASKS
jgi:hypothetical protein